MNTQERMDSYGSNMRVIGYLFNSIKENYREITIEDFQSLTGEISRLFQASAELLPNGNVGPELHMVSTPTITPHPNSPPPLERNLDESNITLRRTTNIGGRQLPLATVVRVPEVPGVTRPRLNNIAENDMEMVFSDLEDDILSTTSEDYQDTIRFKTRPKLTTKCFSNKDGREKSTECAICFEVNPLNNTLTFGCGHEFCNECVCDHFHFSVTNQPYKRSYVCPTCRCDVKKVRVNYSKNDAKNKEDLMTKNMTYEIRTYCNP